MIPEKEGLASGNAAEPERFCWSCFRPLIPGIDDIPIALQDQILQSYKIFHACRDLRKLIERHLLIWLLYQPDIFAKRLDIF